MKIAVLYATQTGKSIHISRIIQRAIMFGYDPQTWYNLQKQVQKHDVIVSDISSVMIQPCQSHIEIEFYNQLEINWNLVSDGTVKVHDGIHFDNGFRNCKRPMRLCFDFIVFVVSTHGDGTHPYSLSHFWNNFVPIPNFSVFGLGDSSYDRFNYCSKRLFNRLRMNHGVGFRRGEGDEQDACGLYTGLKDWLGDLCVYLDELECKTHVKIKETSKCGRKKHHYGPEHAQANTFDTDSEGLPLQERAERMYQSAELVNKVFLTPKGYDRPVLELSFKVEKFCETISIVPENRNTEEFERFLGVKSEWLRVLDFNREPCQHVFLHLHKFLKQKYVNNNEDCIHRTIRGDRITPGSSSSASPLVDNDLQHMEALDNVTFSKVHATNIDAGAHSQSTRCKVPLAMLLARLWDLGTDYPLYYNYVVKRRRSLYSILRELNIRVDVQFLVENLSLIHPRYYTAINTENTCTIVVVLQKNGLCSQYLESMAPGQCLRIGFYKRHVDIAEKMCFVCTGTGISVPLSILFGYSQKAMCNTAAAQLSAANVCELRHRASLLEVNPRLNLPIIVYGFRYKEKDFLYRNLLEALAAEGRIVLHTAVSRENREYVQDVLARLDFKQHEVVVSGSAVLNKHIRSVLVDKKFQSETW